MAKQLDCTTSIESTQNNGIHGIHFGQHTTFNRLSLLASKRKPGLINISGVDWTTSKSNHSIQQMHYQSSSLNSNFGLGDDSWIEDDSHTFGTLYYRDIFNCIQFRLAHLPFQAHLDFEPVRLADAEGHRIYNEMNTGDWWWDTQDQLPTGAMIVPVICASDKTHLTNFSGDQHAWPLYLPIGNISKRYPPHT